MKIYVCIYGGIVSDVFAEKNPESPAPEAVILDVDKERQDAAPIQELWDKIEADPAYERIASEFYAPLDDDDEDGGGSEG